MAERMEGIAGLTHAGRVRAVDMGMLNGVPFHSASGLGFDVIVAQGWQAGGHRGIFDPDGPDGKPIALLPAERSGAAVAEELDRWVS